MFVIIDALKPPDYSLRTAVLQQFLFIFVFLFATSARPSAMPSMLCRFCFVSGRRYLSLFAQGLATPDALCIRSVAGGAVLSRRSSFPTGQMAMASFLDN
jgi:hypothetical protein